MTVQLLPTPTPEEIARDILDASARRRQIAPFSARYAGIDLALAFRVTAELRRQRAGRGETPVGRKIGFTNRTIWAEYGVYAPIWGDMYDTTLKTFAESPAVDLSALLEPRIEPEIAFGIARTPEPGMDEAAILGCIDWVAHGCEIVQSIYPAWRFAAADTVAAYGLHGAYRLGPKHAVTAANRAAWLQRLDKFSVVLFRDGAEIDRGQAANVLDGPLSALRHLVELLNVDPDNPPLKPGEIVTTGTLTRAFPVKPGERWRTQLSGTPIDGIEVRFV
jgi:2-oxo-3-hexenedioate decarboxylase